MNKSLMMKNINDKVWRVLIENFDAVMEYEPALYVYKTIGNKDKGVRSREYSYQFINQLETKKVVKRLSSALDNLKKNDLILYCYIWLRANGYSHKEMQGLNLEVFSGHEFVKKRYRQSRGKHEGTKTQFAKTLVKRARDFLIQNSTKEISQKYSQYLGESKKKKDKDAPTTCPNCNGGGCLTCHSSGAVPYWFAEKMRPKVKDGTWVP